MLLPALFFFLCVTLSESLNQGDSCSLSNGNRGVCTLVYDCQSVKQQLFDGNVPDEICGFVGDEPIVCCPSMSQPPVVPLPASHLMGDGRGAIARQKCAEYSQSVYVSKVIPGDSKRLVNVSQCGIRVINLVETPPRREEFPYMAAVGYDLDTNDIGWYCGGTLISEIFVLTAAHCLYSSALGSATWVRLGDLNSIQSNNGVTPEDRRITQQIKHPQYKPPSAYHDIALLRLESRVPFNFWIRPACLHTAPSIGTTKAIATGWGRTDWDYDKNAMRLMKVSLPIVDAKTCNTSWTSGGVDKLSNGVVDDWMICASEHGKDSCQGDSGGPLVIYSKPEFHCMYDVVGVTSFGKLCGNALPGIYTRVYHYVPWIESVVWAQG